MTAAPARIFDDRPAVREPTPLLVGLIGPSNSGKTYSALRLATGFQSITGGDIHVVDTEARRALHYAPMPGEQISRGKFKFRHVAFGAPFSPLDYLAAIEHCLKKGAKTIIVDSLSHEHEGPGGVLEMHEAEVERLSRGDADKAESVKMLAWGKPKQQRRRLINSILQMSANFIFCFRAKEKVKIERGQKPISLGFMPIAGEEFVYEMTLKCLLMPGANGVPTWESKEVGEKLMIKLPEQFRGTFASKPQLSEEVGEALVRWSQAVDAPKSPAQSARDTAAVDVSDMLARYAACSDPATFRALEEARGAAWKALGADDKTKVKAASNEAGRRIEAANTAPPSAAGMLDPNAEPPPDAAPAKPDPDADITVGGAQ